jgi:RNA 2',3'-cyclic 3'-phosphodiesterase
LINESVKWTDSDNLHLTIVFLGNTSDNHIAEIISMLNEKCRSTGTFEMVLRGSGVFKNFNDPKVIWTGIEPLNKLTDLTAIIIDGLKEIGVKTEERSFKPHLTLGRIRRLNNKSLLKSLIDKYQNTEIQKVIVEEIILYESVLNPSGPVYKPIAEFKL